jgi:hypothetical protein
MSAITKKQKRAYLKEVKRFGRKCPFCGSYKVSAKLGREDSGELAEEPSGEITELGPNWIRLDVECDKCLEVWQEIYKLVDIEYEDSDRDTYD